MQGMDNGAVSVQFISHTPGVESPPLGTCVAANDGLHHAVQNNKTRYVGFAMLSMSNPPAAAVKLE
jgi:predicted TIM-barrel fold metal-dependent hydrolase